MYIVLLLQASFLQEIVDIVAMEEIPPQLIVNWDQAGLNLVPVASWTMELKACGNQGAR